MSHILAIDQGTTSTRAVVFDAAMRPVAIAQQQIRQIYPAPGLVEHDPIEIWQSVLACARQAMARAGLDAAGIAGIGITNQRETAVLWDRATGKPLHNAIVWQDRRTAPLCDALREGGHEAAVTDLTGLLLDPYFSASKIRWLRDEVAGARAQNLAFGTIDTWILWNLTGGRVHATDATNAARTLLCDIHRGCWSDDLCALFGVPCDWLPQVRDCAADFGLTDPALFGGAIAVRGMAGDQQAASMGQACFTPGMMKATYGTGCFALLNTGTTAVRSSTRMLTTIAAQLDGQRTYALEGAIFNAGTVVQWLRDGLGVIANAAEVDTLARAADPALEVLLVPAFTGLGAPYWRPDARGAIFGLTRDSGSAELARAALDSVAHQTCDLWDAMRADWPEGAPGGALRVDGGMAASDVTLQALADLLDTPVDRPAITETTALGAAWLAGMQAGVWPDAAGFARSWSLERRFTPAMDNSTRHTRRSRWKHAVQAVLTL